MDRAAHDRARVVGLGAGGVVSIAVAIAALAYAGILGATLYFVLAALAAAGLLNLALRIPRRRTLDPSALAAIASLACFGAAVGGESLAVANAHRAGESILAACAAHHATKGAWPSKDELATIVAERGCAPRTVWALPVADARHVVGVLVAVELPERLVPLETRRSDRDEWSGAN